MAHLYPTSALEERTRLSAGSFVSGERLVSMPDTSRRSRCLV